MSPTNVISGIPLKNDNELLKLYKNAVRLISNDRFPDAPAVIECIEEEWGNRLAQAKDGDYRATTPNIGMLKSMGYAVGESGEKTPIRRFILDKIMTANLPIVGSPAYTFEWGDKDSTKRYKKLHRTIQSFISGAITRNQPNWEKAIIEWQEDLDFIEEEYRQ